MPAPTLTLRGLSLATALILLGGCTGHSRTDPLQYDQPVSDCDRLYAMHAQAVRDQDVDWQLLITAAIIEEGC